MTKMDTMPIYGKNLWKSFLRSPVVDDFETWYMYVALATQTLPSLFKCWSSVDLDLDLFYSSVKFGLLGFCMRKKQTVDFFSEAIVFDIKIDIWYLQSAKWFISSPKLKTPGGGLGGGAVVRHRGRQHFKPHLLWNPLANRN